MYREIDTLNRNQGQHHNDACHGDELVNEAF
jgi:hypothetical protein